MKRLITLLLVCAALAFSGCATVTKNVTDNVKIVRDALNELLPSNFAGPISLSRHDAYMNLTLEASNVRKVDGEWTWTYVHYERTTSIPISPGLTWKSDVNITLGSR